MKGVRRQLVQVAARPADVLLEGETGTGKELAAKGLHMAWNRPGKLVSVNCGSLQPELAGSELFGHKKGAFTGAQYERLGAFVAANKGTLLLDEVNSLSLDTQAFLLRVLQEREITPLGVNFAQPVDIRVICATNVCLEDEVRAKKFREDLYFRINKRVIVIPPLRDRSEDIVGLAVNFLVKIAVHESGPVVQLDPEAVEFLRQQSWPGNVRQLYNVLDRVVDGIGEDLHVAISDIETALQPRQGTNHAPSEGSAGSYGYQERIASFERDQVLLPALQMTGWNVAAAARELRMNRTRLIGRIQKLGLKREG